MNNKIFIWVLILLICIQFCFNLHFGYKCILAEKAVEQIHYQHERINEKYEFIKNTLKIQHKVLGKQIDCQIELKNRKYEYLVLEDILKDTTYIIYFPPSICNSCNENVLQNLPFLFSVLGNRLRIISSINELNNIIDYCEYQMLEHLYVAEKDIIDSSLKDRESPYFLKISKEGIIQSVFYIQNNMLSVFNEYILFLKSTTI